MYIFKIASNKLRFRHILNFFLIVFLAFGLMGGCGGGDDDGGGEDGTPPPPPTQKEGIIKGLVTTSSGVPLNGVHVRAVSADDTDIQISTFSGIDVNFTVADGVFAIQNVPPGNYKIVVERMDNRSSAFDPSRYSDFVEEETLGQPSFPDEYYNGSDESASDDPNDFVIVTVGSGQTVSGINIIVNN